MKYIFLYLIGAFIFMGCSENKPPKEKELPETSKKTKSPVEDNKVEIETLTKKRDSLLTYFNFKKAEFNSPSYYNKVWPDQYWLREHILMAGLDSAGNYFLTMTTYFPPGNYIKREEKIEVVVYADKDSVQTLSELESDSVLLHYEKYNLFFGTWNPLFQVYDKNASEKVMEFIWHHRNEPIKFILTNEGKKIDGPHSVGQRSRDAISQCYELGIILDEMKNSNEK